VLQDQLERLVECGINLLPTVEITTHFIFERDGFVALVERRQDGFGQIGAPGLLVEQGGFAALVWRAGTPWFMARDFEQRATDDEVVKIRKFAHDLEYALQIGPNRHEALPSNLT
jgi:hypothetical protein